MGNCAGGFDGPVQYDPRLMEVDIGDWQGLTHDQIARRWPGTYQAHETSFELSLNAPEGERYPSLVNRVSAFVSALATPALVVTHGITSSVLRGLLLGLEFDEMAWLGPDQGVVFAIDSGMETILRPASVGPMA
ncbi:histidine phosphatase family protein [Rhodophyticola sp. CCM32]|nr:histidine phosphatase family protein [Rhodophyticola sp. CCM32]QBX99988.1 histidine phosphatase family protein [Rhodophyticola sp. CCM32]